MDVVLKNARFRAYKYREAMDRYKSEPGEDLLWLEDIHRKLGYFRLYCRKKIEAGRMTETQFDEIKREFRIK